MTTPLSSDKTDALVALILSGQKIAAIKLYREAAGVSLKEAKDAVEETEAELRKAAPEKFTAAPKGGGCAGVSAVLGLGAGVMLYLVMRG